MTETTTQDQPTEPTPEEERAAQATAQNRPEGAVPETRPTAATHIDESDKTSALTQKLQDEDYLKSEPATQADYDRAASDSQAKKAEKGSKFEGLMVGNMAVSTQGPHEGRHFAVTRIVSDGSVADTIRRFAGSPDQLYNQPSEVEVRAIGDERDGEVLVLDPEEHGLVKQNEGYRGTRAGRRH